ncbi:hypothetical protein Phi47:1_gp56 [Cellulophaga phage phi47:1]|uniref:hypothetical protein n=1 Tax=Cellulophaga phage phiSM TaxID=756280 RepID=UPI0002B7987E|nr:hypothetical protein CEPG_00057 [Cellulophaga phage phiSM]AGF91614.1 hypothetical protein CDPG_00010 [Cellulophaga phage phi47:1]AGO47787.1 hypothetical protein Phi3ST:2_gp56 [Cellulophaga phage phi3ST:2]AGO49295.1 hypothetical protein Phi38:2_gp56 [Cellulophaga phage phi38:2]AGO49375.1 hypothetical protein Phi3:1_gp56 [Cellulophaga phage phi3:1]AGH07805.1 hypothetical protein CEPG_00057 [Cellulophaga phage phiSM]
MEQGEGIVIQAKLLFETKKTLCLDCEGDIKTFKKEDVLFREQLEELEIPDDLYYKSFPEEK